MSGRNRLGRAEWDEQRQGATSAPPRTLGEVLATFQQWLYLPDPGVILAVLGAVAANLLDGDPVWLVVIGPPGGGKSEALQAAGTLPDVHPAATLTEAALSSGTSRKEHAANAKGGLLREVGDFGIVICKDFGWVLVDARDARAAVLAALREVDEAHGPGTSGRTAGSRSPGPASSDCWPAARRRSTVTTPRAAWASGSCSTGCPRATLTHRRSGRSSMSAASARCVPSSARRSLAYPRRPPVTPPGPPRATRTARIACDARGSRPERGRTGRREPRGRASPGR